MSNFPVVFRVIDIIPQSDSAESDQNSEPSIAVNPVNPAQMFAGTFGDGVPPFFISTDGGATWSIFGTLFNNDKSIAWKVDGSAVLVATMIGMPDFGPIDTHSAFTQLNHYVGSNRNDQPWIRTGPSNHVYVAFNDLGQFNPGNGRTASVNVSTDGGSNYTTVSLDRVGAAVGQDGPAVRVAVNGGRVYSVFDRWTSTVENSANGSRFNSDLVVVRSDNGGMDGFTALGTGGNGDRHSHRRVRQCTKHDFDPRPRADRRRRSCNRRRSEQPRSCRGRLHRRARRQRRGHHPVGRDGIL